MKDQMEHLNEKTRPYHDMSLYAMKVRASVLNRFWRDHMSVKCGFGGDTAPYVRRPFAAVPKATFSFTMAVTDRVEGWKEEKWVGSYLAVHVDVTMEEIYLILEALNYVIDVLCPLQWGLLWFSAPTTLNLKFVNNGTRVAKFRDTVRSAIE